MPEQFHNIRPLPGLLMNRKNVMSKNSIKPSEAVIGYCLSGCSSNNEMELVVKRANWNELENDSYSCQGWNQPYLCGKPRLLHGT